MKKTMVVLFFDPRRRTRGVVFVVSRRNEPFERTRNKRKSTPRGGGGCSNYYLGDIVVLCYVDTIEIVVEVFIDCYNNRRRDPARTLLLLFFFSSG